MEPLSSLILLFGTMNRWGGWRVCYCLLFCNLGRVCLFLEVRGGCL